jgi:hypothetical protein
MLQNKNTAAKAMGSVVRAELARRGQPISSLLPYVEISRGALYSRVRGDSAFNIVELHQVASHLEMTVSELVSMAEAPV